MADKKTIDESYEQLKLFVPVFTGGVSADKLVIELRVPDAPRKYGKPYTEAGFFDLLSDKGKSSFWAAVKGYLSRPADEQPAGIYVTLNPVDPVFLARANNAMGKDAKKISAEDAHILCRRWLLIDADPTRRIAGISACDSEKAAARMVIDSVRCELRDRGFAEPMLCDSGNGFHLWYRIDLPADDGGFVQRTLKGLAHRHNTAGATVDTTVFNASRIMKLPGTFARKGSHTDDRPHRMARVIELPPTTGDEPCVK